MNQQKPEWLRVRVKSNQNTTEVVELLSKLSLHTVCEEANCPNLAECFGRRTATFIILGKVCTRNCTFCNVIKGRTETVDPDEPRHVAEAAAKLGLKHAVVTSVTRDDLPDGGAGHFAEVIREIKRLNSNVVVEVLIPDFQGDSSALMKVIDAKPEIINHNVETVPRLYPKVRPMAVYKRSLELLRNVKDADINIYTKSGIMVGLGESEEEVIQVFRDLRKHGCDLLTVGQYLAPSKNHHPIVEYVHPDVFENYRIEALKLGFKHVASAPLVRSSYMADKYTDAANSD
ncbi:MAG: lipoyl synthase [Clostridia bacterium]|nr:lipoyl synthase [Clostridia bacterium]